MKNVIPKPNKTPIYRDYYLTEIFDDNDDPILNEDWSDEDDLNEDEFDSSEETESDDDDNDESD
jgi:hypothetical protein